MSDDRPNPSHQPRTGTARFVVAAVLCALALGGCCSVKTLFSCRTDPYAMGKITTAGQVSAARISIAAGRVVGPEVQLNDRLDEVDFLQQLMRQSINLTFEADLKRDYSEFFGSRLSASLDVNPMAKQNYELDTLRNDIERAKLQAQLYKLEKDIGDLKAGKDVSIAAPASSTPTSGAAPSASAPTTTPYSEAELNGAYGRLLDQRTLRAARAAGTQSPEARLDDLLRYRGKVRAALDGSRADSLVELPGRVLVKVPMQATLFPDTSHLDWRAIVEMRVEQVGDGAPGPDVYYSWLSAVNRRLNFIARNVGGDTSLSGRSRSNCFQHDARLQPLRTAGLVEFVDIVLSKDIKSDCKAVRVAIHPDDKSEVQKILEQISADNSRTNPGQFNIDDDQNKTRPFRFGLTPQGAGGGGTQGKTVSKVTLAHGRATIFANFLSSLVAALSGLELAAQSDPATAARLHDAAEELQGVVELAPPGDGTWTIKGPPFAFLFLTELASDEKYRVLGIAPVQQTQRVSTVANAANSLSAAFALSAAIPSKGVGLGASSAAVLEQAAVVEAIERSSLVHGYVEEYTGGTRFGWVFSPPISISPNERKLKREQVIRDQDLTASISIPSWWKHFDLKVRSSWVGSLSSPKLLREGITCADGDQCIEQSVRIERELGTADFDSLTRFLLRQAFGVATRSPRIDVIVPETLIAEEGEVELMIQGDNLWRGVEVVVGGKRALGTQVLPDLSGLLVKLNTSALAGGRSEGERLTLPVVVATRDGRATASVQLSVRGRRGTAVTGGVSYSKTRFVAGDELSVGFEPGLIPVTAFEIRVGLAPALAGEAVPPMVSKRYGETDGAIPDRATRVVKGKLAGDPFLSGTKVRPFIDFRPQQNATEVRALVNDAVVFYRTGEDKLKLEQGKLVKDPKDVVKGIELRILWPARVKDGFGGITKSMQLALHKSDGTALATARPVLLPASLVDGTQPDDKPIDHQFTMAPDELKQIKAAGGKITLKLLGCGKVKECPDDLEIDVSKYQ